MTYIATAQNAHDIAFTISPSNDDAYFEMLSRIEDAARIAFADFDE